MTSTWMVKNLMVIAALGLSSSLALAEAGYADAITSRTQKNTGSTGQWFELNANDWLFFEGEASADYNLGAIAQGTKVEVLKMNKQMARVRLPDGRVVFVRNRLLKESSAPTASEKQTQAARTSLIGKTKLHGGNPHAKPKASELSEATVVATKPVVIPKKDEPVVAVEKPSTLGSNTRGYGADPSTAVVDPAAVPLPVPGQATVVTETAPSGVVTTEPVAKADPVVAPSGVAKEIPIPVPRPKFESDKAAPEVAMNTETDGGKCDPKKQWQSPVHQAFRITDCLGSSRDGGGRRHAGLDIAGAKSGMVGVPIFPTANGTVIRSGHNGGYGCFIEIKHKECPGTIAKWRRDQGCVTRYAHLATKTVKNKKGKSVRTCDVPAVGKEVNPCTRIAGMSGTGSSGRSSDYGVHLHFELRDNSTSVAFNPNTLLTGIRGSRHFQSAGSASCKGTNKVDAASVTGLNSGSITSLNDVREGRQ